MVKTIMLVFINAIETGLKNSAKVHLITLITMYEIIGEESKTLKKSEATAPVAPHLEDRGQTMITKIITLKKVILVAIEGLPDARNVMCADEFIKSNIAFKHNI